MMINKCLIVIALFIGLTAIGQIPYTVPLDGSWSTEPFTVTITDTVYIDPDYSGTESGTIDQPFNSFGDFSFTSNHAYLIKRGTSISPASIANGVDNTLIGAYGTGDKPVLHGTTGANTRILALNSGVNYVTIRDLKFVGNSPDANQTVACIFFSPYSDTIRYINIINCEISYSYNGIRIVPSGSPVMHGSTDIFIDSCYVHDIGEDGLFVQNGHRITSANTTYDRINMNWFWVGHPISGAAGDAIQFSYDCDNILIYGNHIDRSLTPHKFCIIHQSDGGNYMNDLIIGNNTLINPKDTVDGTSTNMIFLFDGDTCLMFGNRFGGSQLYDNVGAGVNTLGQWSFDHIFIEYCIFDSCGMLETTFRNDEIHFSNCSGTFGSTSGYAFNLYRDGTFTNCAFGLRTGTTFATGYTADSTVVYVGDTANFDTYFGWENWDNANFSIDDNSILYNMGIVTGDTVDYLGNTVPIGNQDIGAIEYQSGEAPTPPVANFSGTPTTLTEGNTVSFTDLSTNTPTSWSWTFEGGTPSSSDSENPTVTYNTAGIYTVSLTATNADGNDTETKVGYIIVTNPTPPATNNEYYNLDGKLIIIDL